LVARLLRASAIKLIRRATMPFRGPSQGFSSSSQARERRDCQRITAGRDMPGAAKLGFIDAVGCAGERLRVCDSVASPIDRVAAVAPAAVRRKRSYSARIEGFCDSVPLFSKPCPLLLIVNKR
jgi:hypothetical protein